MDGLLCDVEELLRIKTSSVVAEIKEALDNTNCSTDTISKVLEIIQNGRIHSLFDGLDTVYLQRKFFTTYFHYVVSAYAYICMYMYRRTTLTRH